MTDETDRKSKFPLPYWVLALLLLGVGSGGAAGFKGLVTSTDTAERIRALEVRNDDMRERLKEIDHKLDRLLLIRGDK